MYQLNNGGIVTDSDPFIHPGRIQNPLLNIEKYDRIRRREFIETESLGFVP